MAGAMEGQRLLSCRNAREAAKMYIWTEIVLFFLLAVLTLPALGAMVKWPGLHDGAINKELAYGMLLGHYLPSGLLGLAVVAMAASIMSTVDSNMNFGAQVFLNDVYRRSLVPHASMRHYMNVGRVVMFVIMGLAILVATVAMGSYNAGVQAYNSGDKVQAEKLLSEYVAGGGKKAMAFIMLGQIAKAKGEHAKAADYYESAAENGSGNNRCTGYRCLIYSLTKKWNEKQIARGDNAVAALEKEFGDRADAKIAIATWANRRGYEYMKAKKFVAATPWLEKAVAARPDFPLFCNNLAVTYCTRAETAEGKVRVDLAAKAVVVLKAWEGKTDAKLDATRARAMKVLAK